MSIRFVFMSLILHSGLIFLATKKNSPEPRPPVKIKLVERQRVQTTRKAENLAKKIELAGPGKITSAKPKLKSKPKQGKLSHKYRPQNLLRGEIAESATKDNEAPEFFGDEPGRTYKDQSYLQKFAVDLNRFIRVPSYLTENSNYLYGWVRVYRSGEGYIIKTYRGTPYARALIYETLRDVLQREAYTKVLYQGEIDKFEVHFVFRALEEKMGEFKAPPQITVANNRITIQRYRLGINSAAKYIMAMSNPTTGLAQIGPNLLAPLFDLYEFLTEEEEKLPMEVRELHRSRAFKRQRF